MSSIPALEGDHTRLHRTRQRTINCTDIECKICGDRYSIAMPVPSKLFSAIVDAFIGYHSHCARQHEEETTMPEASTEYTLGDKTICGMCHGEIVFKDPHWDHVHGRPRHPAIPAEQWKAQAGQPAGDFQELVREELQRARAEHGAYNSLHEGYAVIMEEICEFWEEVRKKAHLRARTDVLRELVQIAATAQRCAEDCGLVDVEVDGGD